MNFLFQVVTKIFASKTLFVSWLTFLAGLLSYLTGSEFIAQYPEVVASLISILGIVNMALRWMTTLPLSLK